MAAKNRVSQAFFYTLMTAFALLALYPVFSSLSGGIGSGHSFINSLSDGFLRSCLYGLIYGLASAVIAVPLGFAAAFALSKLHSPLAPPLRFLFYAGLFISIQSIIVPLSVRIGAEAAQTGTAVLKMILVYAGISLPLAVCIGFEFINAIPDSIIESARIDGVSNTRIFRSIIFPMCKSPAVICFFLVFSSVWNDLILMAVLNRKTIASLPFELFLAGKDASPAAAAAILCAGFIPALVLFLLFRKTLVRVSAMVRV